MPACWIFLMPDESYKDCVIFKIVNFWHIINMMMEDQTIAYTCTGPYRHISIHQGLDTRNFNPPTHHLYIFHSLSPNLPTSDHKGGAVMLRFLIFRFVLHGTCGRVSQFLFRISRSPRSNVSSTTQIIS